MDAPPLTQVVLCVLEAGHPTGLQLASQGRPRFSAHLGSPPEPSRGLQQRLEPAGAIDRPPALQLPCAIPQHGGGAPPTAAGAGFEHAQPLDPVGERPAPEPPLQRASGRRALRDLGVVVDPPDVLLRDADEDG